MDVLLPGICKAQHHETGIDTHGNRDFCIDGVNCLMPGPRVDEVSAAITRLLGDPALRERLGGPGIETAQEYVWERRIDALEEFYGRVAGARRMAVAGDLAAIAAG